MSIPVPINIMLKMGESTLPESVEVGSTDVTIANNPKVELHQLTPAQREAHERLQLQRAFKGRKLRLQHAYGLPIRTQGNVK
ncbi:hypothetical protein M0R72_16175 [Candidatus Pacearchaeota archaeon]|nr:hypothetical protein [Candidatus Pacearchaeota archaeon]